MKKTVHVAKHSDGGWAVKRQGSSRVMSVHRKKDDAVREAAKVARRTYGEDPPAPPSRAPASDGPRTTLRLPPDLAATADRLARDLHISRNDAILRLAERGARQYEREQEIAARRDARWDAVVADKAGSGDPPSLEEAREAVLDAREDLLDPPH
ncbi:MAG: DUF2188 domain-containing protein [Actinomycetota bacterium]|nr:DUF2188 domain-containing protein [Actinomycetota bacterium]